MTITIAMDTVVLSLTEGQYKVIAPKRFTPHFAPFNPFNTAERVNFMNEYRGLKKYIQNPPSSYRDLGHVYPNLRIDERMRKNIYSCDLKVSFSCPKLLWGHSFEEVTDSHFSQITETLSNRLSIMGIDVYKGVVKNAFVHTLHYSANIMFPSEEEARMFLNRLSKVSAKGWFENNTKIYANDGHVVRFHTDVFEIVFYLKYYDVLEKGNRSVGRKTTLQEKQTAKRLLKEGIVPPVIRMEIRFNGTRSVRTHLQSAIGIYKKYWMFQEVFDSIQSRKTLKYYWDEIINDPINKAYLSLTSDEDICQKVLGKFPGESIKNISEALGLFYFVKNLGVKGTWEIVILRQNRKAWYDKRKKIISFAKRFVKEDDSLIKIVTTVLENKPIQLGLPI